MSEVKNKELQVAALENGTAIDHIPSDKLFKVAALLGLDKEENQITIGNNFPSSKMGSKGMIKIIRWWRRKRSPCPMSWLA